MKRLNEFDRSEFQLLSDGLDAIRSRMCQRLSNEKRAINYIEAEEYNRVVRLQARITKAKESINVLLNAKTRKFNMTKKSEHTTWGHHDTMIVNLRDWVNKEINLMRNSVADEVPHLNAAVSKLLKSAEGLNVQMFDLIRVVADMAEKESLKLTKKP